MCDFLFFNFYGKNSCCLGTEMFSVVNNCIDMMAVRLAVDKAVAVVFNIGHIINCCPKQKKTYEYHTSRWSIVQGNNENLYDRCFTNT